MNWTEKLLIWLTWPIAAVMRQLRVAQAEIEKADRPTDGIGAAAAATIVLINPRFEDTWQNQVADEAVQRFGDPRSWMKVVADEAELEDKPYRLDDRELADYRRGVPIIKKILPYKERPDLGQGGRPLEDAEVRLREALGYQVYIRTEQARALLGAQPGCPHYTVPQGRENVWKRMAEAVGYRRRDDLPRLKLRARDGDERLTREELAKIRRQRSFEALFKEGAKLAVKSVYGAKTPDQVSRLAIMSGERASPGDVKAELATIFAQVVILYRAYIAITRKTSFVYRFWNWLRGGIPARRKKRRIGLPPRRMRAGQHRVLAAGSLRPAELLLVAYHADVNPLLINPRHFGCAPAFEAARKFGRFLKGCDERLSGDEIEAIREAFVPWGGPGRSEYDAMHADLRRAAIEIFPADQWRDVLAATASNPAAVITLSHDRAA